MPTPVPHGFSWIEKPLLAGMAHPESEEDLEWLRQNGIDVLLSLTEDPVRRDWANDAGLLVVHEPMVDMEAPSQEQLERCVSAIERANGQQMGVAVHCGAGLGRTGVVLAAYFVHKGEKARDAIAHVRRLRPGSIETSEQAAAVTEFARRKSEG
ncbi:MAG TPA: dual specificity protein phosphatase family protein [Gemmataceae bacterium]|nr:dual specificity protein phosphatase family protein [Gemmataceae bacterium]